MSTTSTYKYFRRKRLSMYRNLAQSKTSECFAMKTVYVRRTVEIALECDQERRIKLASRLEHYRAGYNEELRKLHEFVATKRAVFAGLKRNPEAMRNIATNKQFIDFVREYEKMQRTLSEHSTKVQRQLSAVRSVESDIRRWKDSLAQIETEDDEFDTTEIMNLTSSYLETRPVDTSVEVRRDAQDRLGDAIESATPFDIADESGQQTTEAERSKMAEMVKMLFGSAQEQRQAERGIFDDMYEAPSVGASLGASTAGVAVMPPMDEDVITFGAERAALVAGGRQLSSGRQSTTKSRSMFDEDGT